jgi:serine/threonine-protein kinase
MADSFLPEHPPIPGYEPERLLGRNGAIVYLARRSDTGELVALKVYNGSVPPADLRRQELTLARLNHPNVLRVIGIGECEGRAYTALEYAATSLAARLRDGPLQAAEAGLIAKTLALTLQHMRELGFVHVNLRPSSVLLTDENIPKLFDFERIESIQEWEEEKRILRLIGRPDFAAPEELTGQGGISTAIDIYRVGAILYALLTGRPPFTGDSETLIGAVVERPPVAPRQLNPGASGDGEAICLKCLEKRPERRYASLGHLAEDLGQFLRFHRG